jgi:2,3-bisphosphoglycerate-independent phosphoglycerate mutase
LPKLDNTLGEYISKLGLNQLRIAETEKYAHVTYFFDGGIEKELDNCKRILIPSPKVATYDLKPEMSAREITDKLLPVMENYDVIILNFANGDMVGHTGVIPAAITAVECVDECLGKIYKKIEEIGGTLIVTADHGNCDWMLDDDNNVITSHSVYPVPFIINRENIKLKDGKLADIAPTILHLLDMEIPEEMNGINLIEE